MTSAGTCSRETAKRMAGGDLQRDVAHELLEFLVRAGASPCPRRLPPARRLSRRCGCRRRPVRCRRLPCGDGGRSGCSRRILATCATRSASKSAFGFGREPFGDVIAERAEPSLRATKSVSQLISTSTPTRAAGRDVLGDDAFVGFAARLFRRRTRRLFCAECPRRLHVALGFDERLFAIHQARAGHFAEFADLCSSNFSHKN